MKISNVHSHLNGLEFMLVNRPELWREIQDLVSGVDIDAEIPKGSSWVAWKKTVFALLRQRQWQDSSNRKVKALTRDRVLFDIGLSKNDFPSNYLFAIPLALFALDEIDVGIQVLPMNSLRHNRKKDAACYLNGIHDLVKKGRGIPAVPLVIIGVDA